MVKNMKIIIHGTKGGHHTFTDEKVEMIDARPDSSKVAAIGQQAYSINFNDGDVVFSKYKIVRDVAGEKRTGHIAFSVIIPNEKKLSGMNVKLLLDELAEDYCKKYVENNNLDNVREDWQFVEEINAKFIKEVKNALYDNESFQQGTEEAAFIYYSSDYELQNYFDDPYQDNYKRFKQIFFVDEKFESKPENPLNALRHNPSSNLTKGIDVQNLKFTLFFDETNIKVQEGDINCRNNSKVHKKSIFKICYSEPHRESREISGTLEDIRSYIDLDQDKRIIKIKNQELTPIKYTFNFIMTDQNSNPISDAKVVGKYLDQEVELPNPFSVTYEESKEYIVYAKKDDTNLISEETPLKKCFTHGEPPTPIEIKLFLKKRPKEIRIIVQDEDSEQPISEFTVLDEKHREIDVFNNKIKFSGNEIDKNITIRVRHEGYKISAPQQFIPEEKESIIVKLKRTIVVKKEVAQSTESVSEISQDISNNKSRSFDKSFIILILSGVCLLAIIITSAFHIFKNNPKKHEHPYEVKEYLEGVIIDSCYTTDIKNKLCEKDSNTIYEGITGQPKDTSPPICSQIKTSLIIYEAIKQGYIEKLKQIKIYSPKQENFKKAIESIKEEYKTQIGDSLKNIAKRYGNFDSIATIRVKNEIGNLEKAKSNIKKLDTATTARVESKMDSLIKNKIDSLKKEMSINSDTATTTRIESEIESIIDSLIKSEIDSLKKTMSNINLDNVANFIIRIQDNLIAQQQQNSSSSKEISSSSQVKPVAQQKSSSSNKEISSSSQAKAVTKSPPSPSFLETDFWKLINKANCKIAENYKSEDFKSLYMRYESEKNEYVDFLKNKVSKPAKLNEFIIKINNADCKKLQGVKKLPDLEKILEGKK
jgi:hypothetical protein